MLAAGAETTGVVRFLFLLLFFFSVSFFLDLSFPLLLFFEDGSILGQNFQINVISKTTNLPAIQGN